MVEEAIISFFAITCTAVVYTALSSHAQKILGNRDRAKQIQDEMNRINNIASEAMKTSDEKKKKEAELEQEKMGGLMKEMMILNFKPLIITLPVFYGLSAAMRSLFPAFQIKLAFALPIFIQNLDKFPNWRSEFGVLGWFILTIIFSGLLIQAITGKMLPAKKKPAGQNVK